MRRERTDRRHRRRGAGNIKVRGNLDAIDVEAGVASARPRPGAGKGAPCQVGVGSARPEFDEQFAAHGLQRARLWRPAAWSRRVAARRTQVPRQRLLHRGSGFVPRAYASVKETDCLRGRGSSTEQAHGAPSSAAVFTHNGRAGYRFVPRVAHSGCRTRSAQLMQPPDCSFSASGPASLWHTVLKRMTWNPAVLVLECRPPQQLAARSRRCPLVRDGGPCPFLHSLLVCWWPRC